MCRLGSTIHSTKRISSSYRSGLGFRVQGSVRRVDDVWFIMKLFGEGVQITWTEARVHG